MDSPLIQSNHTHFMPIAMRIGPGVQMIGVQHPAIASFLVQILFHGAQRNNTRLRVLVCKPNIEVSLLQVPN
jgi:hypothetical protein